MSRSGYSDDCDNINLYRGNVERVLRSKRGRAFLVEMAAALDAMDDKQLELNVLVCETGCCAMGAVALARGLDTHRIDPEEPDDVASAFGINRIMAAEIAYENDEGMPWSVIETPEQRWVRMRQWVAAWLAKAPLR